MSAEEPTVSMREAMRRAHIGYPALRRMIASGRVRCVRQPRPQRDRFRIPVADVDDLIGYLQQQEQQEQQDTSSGE